MGARDLGKLKTWAQTVAATLAGFQAAGLWDADVAWWALLVATLLTWISGLDYARSRRVCCAASAPPRKPTAGSDRRARADRVGDPARHQGSCRDGADPRGGCTRAAARPACDVVACVRPEGDLLRREATRAAGAAPRWP